MVLVVILGRTGRTEFNFPATIAALVANIALNLALVPPLGIVGAGIALVASYVVVLALMYVFTQRLFPVPYEWGRLARVVAVSAALVGLGELLLPTEGFAGLAPAPRSSALAYPFALLATGFFTRGERRWLARLRHPAEVLAGLQALRPAAAGVDGSVPETYEAELRTRTPASERQPQATACVAAMLVPRRGTAPGGRGPSRRAPAGWAGRRRQAPARRRTRR